EPIRRISDLKGRKVWSPEGDLINETTIKTAGVTPVPLPFADVYTGLQTGLLDTVGGTPMAAIALQWHTKIKYVVDVPLMYLIGIFAIERKAFKKISSADQNTVRKVMGKKFRRLDLINRKDNAGARDALISQGIEFIQPTREDLELWKTFTEEAIARLKDEGVYSPKMLDTIKQHLKVFRSQQPKS
ncbi:TRAP transporter substrate-binding protein DctP, partial [Pseudomonadota bacterium]